MSLLLGDLAEPCAIAKSPAVLENELFFYVFDALALIYIV
jgi:hypothetical protein